MDYVSRKMEQAKQQKIDEAMKRHKRSLVDTQVESDSGFTFEKFFSYLNISKNTFLVLMGVAAGVAITATAVWVKSGEFGIEHVSQNIDLLNKRVALLDDNITNIEGKLTRLQILTDSIKITENKQVSADQQYVSEIADAMSAVDSMEPAAAGLAPKAATREEVFTPTHTVTTKLNLRPSPSLNTTPIGILSAGTKVEKISENGNWFHVSTETQGQGWCSSDYLSPL
jgi:uncharacterized protein YgiM (DUF1202 family)